MNPIRNRWFPFCLTATAVLLGGCTIIPEPKADPTKFYVLTEAPAASADKPAGRWVVGVQSLELPAYLRTTKSMVARTGANELRFEEFARWAEPLDAGLRRVIKDQLARAPGIARVVDASARDGRRDYDVAVRIDRCEGLAGRDGGIALVATYEIVALREDGRVLTRKLFSAPAGDWDGSDYSALARLLSEAAAKLANDIAANLPKAE